MSIGIWVVAGSSLLTALSQSFSQLLVLRGVGGIGSSMFTVSAMALLLRTAGPDQRGRASGAFQAGFLFGGVAGPAIGGAVVGISIRAPFVVYGVTLVVAGLLAVRFLSRDPQEVAGGAAAAASPAAEPDSVGGRSAGSSPEADSTTEPAAAALRAQAEPEAEALPQAQPQPHSQPRPASLGRALRSAAYRAALMANLSSGFIVFGLRISLVPLFVTEGLEQGVGLVGLGFLSAAAVQAVTLIPAGRWTDRAGRRGSMLMGAGTMTVSMLLLALDTGSVGFLLAMAASGLASAFLAPASAAVVGDVTRGLSGGRVVSAYQMVGDLGGILGPLIAGALADAAGFEWAFAAGVVVGLITMAFIAVMPETLRKAEPAPAGA
jgi:MFS family permease